MQNTTNLKYLLCRLDFNEYYQNREEEKKNFGRGNDSNDGMNYGDEEEDDDEEDDDEDDEEDDDEDDEGDDAEYDDEEDGQSQQ